MVSDATSRVLVKKDAVYKGLESEVRCLVKATLTYGGGRLAWEVRSVGRRDAGEQRNEKGARVKAQANEKKELTENNK